MREGSATEALLEIRDGLDALLLLAKAERTPIRVVVLLECARAGISADLEAAPDAVYPEWEKTSRRPVGAPGKSQQPFFPDRTAT